MKRLLWALLLLPDFAHAQAPAPLRIAAAADLEPVLPAVLDGFRKASGVQAEVTYQSSAVLTQQIFDGAPYDLFLAADTGFPQRLADKQLTVQPSPVVYAKGTLVLWARHQAPVLHGLPLSFAVLRNPALASVAIANPQTAPYGRAAQAAINGMFLNSTLAPKLRIAPNIAAAAQFADSGSAEVGFLSLTSALTPRLAADGSYLAVPKEVYPPILQAGVVLKGARNARAAGVLLDYLRTPAARAAMQARGLEPAP